MSDIQILKKDLLEPSITYIEICNGRGDGSMKGRYHQRISNIIYDFLRPPDKSSPNWNMHWLPEHRGAEIHDCNAMSDITDFLDETIGLPTDRALHPIEVKRFARKFVDLLVNSLPKFAEELAEI